MGLTLGFSFVANSKITANFLLGFARFILPANRQITGKRGGGLISFLTLQGFYQFSHALGVIRVIQVIGTRRGFANKLIFRVIRAR